MNNKGQVLVMFLILLPVVLILFAYLVDKCYLLYQKNNLNNIGDIVCTYALDNNKTEDNIKQLILENDSSLENIKITRNDNYVLIVLEKNIDSMFGNLLGIDKYTVKTKTKCNR